MSTNEDLHDHISEHIEEHVTLYHGTDNQLHDNVRYEYRLQTISQIDGVGVLQTQNDVLKELGSECWMLIDTVCVGTHIVGTFRRRL